MTRLLAGLLTVLLSLAGSLAVLFLFDWCFHFSRIERTGLLLGFLGLMLWSYWRWLRPALRHRESELQLALWLERDHPPLRGQLADPLQYASVETGTWGSRDLEQAVVAQVAAVPALPRLVDPQSGRCRRLIIGTIVSAAGIALLLKTCPAECATFARRLLLGAAAYPTRTTMTRVSVNGTVVTGGEGLDESVHVPFGAPLEFVVECAGVIPREGTIEVLAPTTGQRGILPLKAGDPADEREATADAGDEARRPGRFFATGNRLVEDLTFEVRLGDARTWPVKITVVPLPVIRMTISATPPGYAKQFGEKEATGSPPTISVFQGSRITIVADCANKPLESARLTSGGQDFPLEPQGPDKRTWVLNPDATPFAQLLETRAYELSVVDVDGLSPPEPLRGSIGISRDEAPRVALAAVTLHVLPKAEPSLAWGVTDDYGVDNVRLLWQVTGMSGSREGAIELRPKGQGPAQAALRGTQRVPLAPLNVVPGDEVRLTLQAVDRRGDQPGAEVSSEPVVLHVTDEAGILSALAEADQKSATELDELIERQLRSGEAP
jgi:hypothetical protein